MRIAIGENASIEFPLNSDLRQIGTLEDNNVPRSPQHGQGGYLHRKANGTSDFQLRLKTQTPELTVPAFAKVMEYISMNIVETECILGNGQNDKKKRHFSLIPTAQAAFFLRWAPEFGGERSPDGFARVLAAAASAACCQQTSSSSTTQRTTHLRFRQR